MVGAVVLVASKGAVAVCNLYQIVVSVVSIGNLAAVRQGDPCDPLFLVHLHGKDLPRRCHDRTEVEIRIIHQLCHVAVDVCDAL